MRAEIVIVPPSGMASRALMTRLTSAVSNSATSTMTGQTSGSMSNCSVTALPTPVSSTSRTASIRSATSIACGLTLCRRAKVSNWLVRAAPRLVAASIADIARCSLGSSSIAFLQRVKAAADDHQEIVEIVRHAAGQLAERVELLRFRQLLLHLLELELGLAALGDVAGDLGEADELAVLVDRVDDDAGPEEGAVLADAPAFLLVAALFPGNAQRAERLAVGAVGFGVEAGEVLADDLVGRIALDPLAADIPAGHDAGRDPACTARSRQRLQPEAGNCVRFRTDPFAVACLS